MIGSREASLLVRYAVIDKPPVMKEVYQGLTLLAMATAIQCGYYVKLDCPTGNIILESENGVMQRLYKSESENRYKFARVQELHRYIYTCGGKTRGTWSTEGARANVTSAGVRIDYGMIIPGEVSGKIVSVCRPSSADDTRSTTRSQTAPRGREMTMAYDDLTDNMDGVQVCNLHIFIDGVEIDNLEIKLTRPITPSPVTTPRYTSSTSAINTNTTSTTATSPATSSSSTSSSKVTPTTTSGPGPSSALSKTPTSKPTTTTTTTTSTSLSTSPTSESSSTTSPTITTRLPENDNSMTTGITSGYTPPTTTPSTNTTTTNTLSPEALATTSAIEPKENTTTTSKLIEGNEDHETKSESDALWVTIYSLVGVFGMSLAGGLVFVVHVLFLHCKARYGTRGGCEARTDYTYRDGDRPMAQVNVNMESRDPAGTEDDSGNRMIIAPPKPARTRIVSLNELKDSFMKMEGRHTADRTLNDRELEDVGTAADDYNPQNEAVTEDDDGGKPNFKETAV